MDFNRFLGCSLLLVGLVGFGISGAHSQNVGIGVAVPLEKLHVAGNLRINTLAGVGTRIAAADVNGTLAVIAAGTTGQVLTQTAGGPAFSNASNDWTILGNAGTTPALNFAGTTDAQAFAFRTTNVERARITAGGLMVVNSTAPFAGDIFSSYAAGTNYAVNGYSSGSGAAGYFSSSATGSAVIGFQSGTLGSGGQFTTSGAGANTSSTVDVYNQTGSSPAMTVRTDLANANADGIELDINGAAAKRGIDMYVDVATTGIGLAIFHDGTNRAINAQQQNTTNTQPCIFANVAGNARVLNAQTTLTTNTTQIGFFSQGSTGLANATYGNAAAVWGQSSGIRGAVFLAAGASVNTTVVQGNYSGAAGNYDGIGVLGTFAPAALYGYGVVGQGNWYGVFANGDLGASGFKAFMIDHPLDPTNKYLRHFSMESDEVLNMYRGTVTLDAAGQAVVKLPDYASAINIDFSYQLTPLGAPAATYIASELNAAGEFTIAGGNPGQKICWNVYAQRNDEYAKQNPLKAVVEMEKRPHEKGYYMMPELYNQPASMGIIEKYKADPSKVSVQQDSGPDPQSQQANRMAPKPLAQEENNTPAGSGGK